MNVQAQCRVVDILPAIRSSRFDLPLTYRTEDLDVQIGEVVRVPLGRRETLGYVVSRPTFIALHRKLRAIHSRTDAPPAFSVFSLQLARWMAEQYLCTLGEALSAVMLNSAVPRSVDVLTKTSEVPPKHSRSVPRRLIEVIWEDLPPDFSLETLLRHPHARRAGERSTLLRAVGALVRSGNLVRKRSFFGPRISEYRVKLLYAGDIPVTGCKTKALLEFVAQRCGVSRAETLLAGFSTALISRAIRVGALHEQEATCRLEHVRRELPAPEFTATPEQARAIERIGQLVRAKEFGAALLHGITGSGKTFVYIEAIKRVVAGGERALVLVPEISLTPQIASRFEEVSAPGWRCCTRLSQTANVLKLGMRVRAAKST